jgi:hypothetical protein
MGEDERDMDRRPAVRTDMALSIAPGFCSRVLLSGEPGRLDIVLLFDEGEALVELVRDDGAQDGGSHMGRNESETGMEMRVCMTCVSGGASGLGNVGGRELKTRSKGARKLR